jgi:pyruvate formate lyase activating enzyme
MKEALFYSKLEGGKVRCLLCARRCFINPGKAGLCKARKNIGGTLYALTYGKPCAISTDPIEKKPLFHFLPGTFALSISARGCNFRCKFCQNYAISQIEDDSPLLQAEEMRDHRKVSPSEIVKAAKKEGAASIAYTYTEPTVFYEYALEIMKLAKAEGLKNIWVTNGYINKEPLRKMAKYLDAVNIDIKGNEAVYKSLCLASQKPVLSTLKEFKKQGIWIELTILVIPGHNDSPKWVEEICRWIAENLGEQTPLHLSRFFPSYRMGYVEPTPLATLESLHGIAKKSLKYVYIGNLPLEDYETTYCARCGHPVIKRSGYKIYFKNPSCPKCGEKIEGAYL